MKQKILTLTLIFGCFMMVSLGQSIKEKADQKAKDPATRENAAKADVIIQQRTITPPSSGQQIERQERRSSRLQQKMARRKRLRRSFHGRHSLMKRR